MIENNVDVTANSGGNEANGNGGDSFIMTGDAYAGSNVVNQINQNITNTDSFFLLIRVHGNWAGSVYGTPEELAWTETSNGVALYNGSSQGLSGGSTNSALSVQNNNTAAITNNVNVYALTGENHINGNSENAGILSGDAYAGANIVNVANTNVIGQNWALAIINIFGDWNGSISFGQPDLWIGGQIDTKGIGYLDVGGKVIYHYTVINNSDTTAPEVRVIDKMDEYITFNSSLTNGHVDGGNVVWNIGDLGPGESAEVEYEAFVNSKIPSGSSAVENVVTVSNSISDANYNDNTDVVSLVARRFAHSVFHETNSDEGLVAPEFTPDPVLSISKTNSATTTLFAGVTVDYTIIVRNDGGEAYNSILFDTLKDDSGYAIYEQSWLLDTIYPDEEIIIEYSIVYDEHTIPGAYINYAQVEAIAGDSSLDPIIGTFISSSIAISTINIVTNTPPVSAAPTQTIIESVDEIQDSLPTVKLDNKKLPVIIRKTTGIGYLLHSLIKGEMFTPVPALLGEEQKEDGQVVIGSVHILDKLGGFAFVGSGAAQFSSLKSLGNKHPVSDSKNAPYGQFASIFDSLIKNWALLYFWAFLLVLLGFTLPLIIRARADIIH